jgi:thioredoxin-like negative regulator of GroEL
MTPGGLEVPAMKTHRLTPLVAVCCALGAATARAQDIAWRYDYNRARQEALDKSRPILIDFGTEACFWCKQLDTRTFTDPEIRALLNDRFVPLKVDAHRSPDLAEKLNIKNYPTLVFAGPDGRILGYQEGFLEPPKLKEQLTHALAVVAAPEWMARDYQEAARAHAAADFAKAVSLLKNIVEDGKDRPVQARARQLLTDIENQAAGKLAEARQQIDRGHTRQGFELLTGLTKQYPGTPAAREATVLSQTLASRSEGSEERARRARDLLARAREDYKAQLFLCCLDRCEVLIGTYSDLPEAAAAGQMAQEIKSNPEWMKQAADQSADRLCLLYLTLADTWLKKGQPQQATFYLERVIQLFPNTRHAEIAQIRLSQIQGASSKSTGFKR